MLIRLHVRTAVRRRGVDDGDVEIPQAEVHQQLKPVARQQLSGMCWTVSRRRSISERFGATSKSMFSLNGPDPARQAVRESAPRGAGGLNQLIARPEIVQVAVDRASVLTPI